MHAGTPIPASPRRHASSHPPPCLIPALSPPPHTHPLCSLTHTPRRRPVLHRQVRVLFGAAGVRLGHPLHTGGAVCIWLCVCMCVGGGASVCVCGCGWVGGGAHHSQQQTRDTDGRALVGGAKSRGVSAGAVRWALTAQLSWHASSWHRFPCTFPVHLPLRI